MKCKTFHSCLNCDLYRKICQDNCYRNAFACRSALVELPELILYVQWTKPSLDFIMLTMSEQGLNGSDTWTCATPSHVYSTGLWMNINTDVEHVLRWERRVRARISFQRLILGNYSDLPHEVPSAMLPYCCQMLGTLVNCLVGWWNPLWTCWTG